MSLEEPLDLSDDRLSLQGLKTVVPIGESDLREQMDRDLLDLKGIPHTGLLVQGRFYEVTLQRVRILQWSWGPGTRGPYLAYEITEILWTRSTSDRASKVGERYRGSIKSFDFTLLDAIARLKSLREKYVQEMREYIQRQTDSIASLQKDMAKLKHSINETQAIDIYSVVPQDELEAEDLAIEAALLEVSHG